MPLSVALLPEESAEKESMAPPLIDELLPLLIKDKNVFLDKVKVTEEQQRWVADKSRDQKKFLCRVRL